MTQPERLVVSYARRMRVRDAYERSTRRVASDAARRPARSGGVSGVGAYRRWCAHADTVGFPVGGMTSVLLLGADAVEVHTTTFVRSRPKARVGSVPLDRIREFRVAGGVLHTKLVMLLDDGGIVEFETALRPRAKRFIAAVLERRDGLG